jgi:hypothetical protein
MSRIRESGLSPSPRDGEADRPVAGMLVGDPVARQEDDVRPLPGVIVTASAEVDRGAQDSWRSRTFRHVQTGKRRIPPKRAPVPSGHAGSW